LNVELALALAAFGSEVAHQVLVGVAQDAVALVRFFGKSSDLPSKTAIMFLTILEIMSYAAAVSHYDTLSLGRGSSGTLRSTASAEKRAA